MAKTNSGRVKHVFAHALHGFAAEMTEDEAIALSQDPRVAYVEEDAEMEIVTTQTNATWGLDRIDQANRPLNGTYTYTSTGNGVNAYIRNSINSGVTYAVAAGNSNTNAANSSPARVGAAITVGSSTSSDARSSFSNFGSVVDIFAPGSGITSAWSTSNTAINTISGTSMAAPHAAGVAARYLQNNRTASAATVRNAIVNAASLNKLTGLPSGTANRLLFWSGAQ